MRLTKLNAKELILAKVNAGNKLAKMYLFLITLGFDINDIVKFMTSPAINFIDAITDTNIFIGQDISLKQAINIAKGDYSTLVKGEARAALYNNNKKDLIELLEKGDIENFTNPFAKDTFNYNAVEDLVILIGSIKHLQHYDIQDQNILNDIKEFENVMEGADEFSALGQVLGINQGIPTSKLDLLKKVTQLKKLYADRFSKTKTPMEEELDVLRFFTDPDYAKYIKDLYDKVKKCINIFDLITHIPLFKALFDIFSAVVTIDHNLVIKTLIYDYAYNQLSKKHPIISEKYLKNLLSSIDNVFISMFLNTLLIKIPYMKEATILEENRQSSKAVENGWLQLNSLGKIATFKYLFENLIIPDLKRGIVREMANGKIIKRNYEKLLTNPFIKSLLIGYDKDVPLYKCDLNMMTIDNSNDSKIKFLNYINGLKALKNIRINHVSILDLFVLYNLIVNKNQYGADRLTTLFDSFLLNTEELSMIKQYLTYLGDLDYNGKVSGEEDTITISYRNEDTTVLLADLKCAAAPIVGSLKGLSDPTVIINEEDGPKLYEKIGHNLYEVSRSLIPTITGESMYLRLERIYNDKAYFVLGGNYKFLVDRLVENLQEIDNRTISAIRDLLKLGVLIILKICQ